MRITFSKYVLAAVSIVALASCKKNTFSVTERGTPSGVAFVKVAYLSSFTVNSNTQVFFNGERLTNNLVYATSFPGSGLNMTGSTATSDYLALTPGMHKVEFIVPVAGVTNPLRKVYETSKEFYVDQKQTLYIADTASSTVSFVLGDETAIPDSILYKIRFINAMPNVPSMDFYRGANNTTAVKVASDVKFAGGTEHFQFTAGTDSFFVRPAGAAATTAPIVRRGFALGPQRIFSLVARGYNGQAATATRAPHLSVIINH